MPQDTDTDLDFTFSDLPSREIKRSDADHDMEAKHLARIAEETHFRAIWYREKGLIP